MHSTEAELASATSEAKMLALLDLCLSCVRISKNGLISASLTVSQVRQHR